MVGGGPEEITSATLVPPATIVPAMGVWLTTDPAGTIALVTFDTVPTSSPALVSVVAAAACAMFTTDGIATGGGPVETARLTAVPTVTDVPAIGLSLTTLPAGTVTLA